LFFAEVEIDPVDVIQVKNCVLMCPDSGMHACMYAPSD
jgi:hypothetical protein